MTFSISTKAIKISRVSLWCS